jgi:hypothetical protein
MQQSTLDRLRSRYDGSQPIKFIDSLVESGVNLSKIDVNDWDSSPRVFVYIGEKTFQRFGPDNLESAKKEAGV